MDTSTPLKLRHKKLKYEILNDIFGLERGPDMLSPYDRWINIQAVVRKVYREAIVEFDLLSKRWTEITPSCKYLLQDRIMARLEECDRRVLQHRADIVEKLLKDHISNRMDWEREKRRKLKPRFGRQAGQAITFPIRDFVHSPSPSVRSPEEENSPREFIPPSPVQKSLLTPLPSLVEQIKKIEEEDSWGGNPDERCWRADRRIWTAGPPSMMPNCRQATF
ncbi:hypothetical protein AA313_de0200822 [Arthrobotrys entomopaga]|nr:hypothetical protein AA313_de0200822 [Arthrobotrys entomopaga]